tara:strand:- start:1331 stop:2467 length:1137 start_codon:yes stop_codon:yes gene_type:complete
MILFIGHEASLTGAPKSLLIIISHIKKNYREPIIIVLKQSGELIKEYEKLGKVLIWEKPWYNEQNFFKRINNRFFDSNSYRQKKIKKYFKKSPPKLIFNNTIANGNILKSLSFLMVPVISRLPELEFVMKIYDVRHKSTKNVLKYSSYFITPSISGKKNLVTNFKIPKNKVEVSYGTLDPKNLVNNSQKISKKELGIKEDSFIVGTCGTLGWRKGSDLFLRVAKQLIEEERIIFIWVGADKSLGSYYEFIYEIEKLNLGNKVMVINRNKEILKYYKIMDIFLMTSREDPFPLVNLEAAINNVPIICFKDSGGSEEFVDASLGFVVPYADTNQMSKRILELYSSSDLKLKLSNGAFKKAENFLSVNQFKIIEETIEKYI